MWLQSLLKSLSHAQDHPSCIHCDNIGSNILTHDQSFHAWTKHIDIQHHYIHEQVKAGDIHYAYIPTHDNLADCLTKSLSHPKFQELTTHMGMHNDLPT